MPIFADICRHLPTFADKTDRADKTDYADRAKLTKLTKQSEVPTVPRPHKYDNTEEAKTRSRLQAMQAIARSEGA